MGKLTGWLPRDPRTCQTAALSLFLLYGVTRLGLPLSAGDVTLTITTALATQFFFSRAYRLPHFDPRSALITALSLCLLLRSATPVGMMLGAAIAVASKFVVRLGGRHLFNPSNLTLVLMIAVGWGWVTPGQWGNIGITAVVLAGTGAWVVTRAARLDLSLAFLGFWALILIGRGWILGDPLGIALHSLKSGSLLLFAFFMLSDPKTTPRGRLPRVAFALAIALGGYLVTFWLFEPHGFLWSLVFCTPLAPLFDRIPGLGPDPLPGLRPTKENRHEETLSSAHPHRHLAWQRLGLLRLLRRQGGHSPLQQQLSRGARTAQ